MKGKITLQEARLFLRDETIEDEALALQIGMAEATIEGLTGCLAESFPPLLKQAALAMLSIIYDSDARINYVYGLIAPHIHGDAA